MSRGVVRQVDVPERLYDHPSDLFVASFIGSPPMNMVATTLERGDDGALHARFGSTSLTLDAAVLARRPELARFAGERVILGVRPEDLTDPAALDGQAAEGLMLEATIDLRESLGSEVYVHFALDAEPVVTEETREVAADLGAETLGELEKRAAERTTTFIARLQPRTPAREGDRVRLALNPRGLHFFDPQSGRRIADAA
jgi:multiple sugar transport system ATP-binding protein